MKRRRLIGGESEFKEIEIFKGYTERWKLNRNLPQNQTKLENGGGVHRI